jgi:hypothetical protein
MSNPFHFPSDDREELFGKRKFSPDWIGRQTPVDLKLLAYFYAPYQYVAGSPGCISEGDLAEVHALSGAPLEEWEFRGPAAWRDEALAFRARAFTRKKQLIWVREALRLIDKHGERPKHGSADFERLDPGDDRQTLREARRLFAEQSTLENDLDGRDLTGVGAVPEGGAASGTGPKVVSMKPPWRPSGPLATAVAVALKECGLENQRPDNLTLKQIATRIALAVGKATGRRYTTGNEEAALEKAVGRYYAAVAKEGTPPDISDIMDMSAMSGAFSAQSRP